MERVQLHKFIDLSTPPVQPASAKTEDTFGGSKRNRLFMTGSQSLYAVYVETRGAHIT
jgi:sugar lactone lactonase YvrE